jgi:hypothetical protein
MVTVPASGGTVQAFDDRMREDYVKGRLRFFLCAAVQTDGSALDFIPSAGDIIIFEGSKWEISGNTPLNPAGTPVLHSFGAMEGGRA